MFFIEVMKDRQNDWFGINIMATNLRESSFIIYKSYSTSNSKLAQLLALREVLLRFKEVDATFILCRDPKKNWRKFFENSTTVN